MKCISVKCTLVGVSETMKRCNDWGRWRAGPMACCLAGGGGRLAGSGPWPVVWRAGVAGWQADRWSVDWRARWATAKVLHLCAFLALRQIDRLADGRHQSDYRDQGNRADGID